MKTQKELYIWWKDTRPARPDAYEVTGWNEANDAHPVIFWKDERCDNTLLQLSQDVNNLEESWHQEDENMLKKLILIRRTLWT